MPRRDRRSDARSRKPAGLLRLALRLAFGVATVRRPRESAVDRIAAFRRLSLPVRHATRVHWDDHLVPFVEAQEDRDAAVAMGAVHGHLRLGQIEIMRRIATGRLSQALGPVAVEVDHTVRTLDFGRAVPAILDRLPAPTRTWLDGYAEGLTAAAEGSPPPEELAILGLSPEPWNAADVLTIGRLAAMDFSWKVWHRLMDLRAREDWTEVWRRLVDGDGGQVPHLAGAGSGAPGPLDAAAHQVWLGLGRTGSNGAAVAGRRSTTGSALLSGDPHLAITAPTNWLALGLRSPSYEAVGLTIPGVPAIAIGRNPHIAWSGTSLHAASSDLFDVSDEAADGRMTERTETIEVRWSSPRTVTIREAAPGPVISDAPLVRSDGTLAIAWMGHRPSDEIGALLGIMQARSWADFTAALDGLAVPAQNFVMADAAGGVGRAMAAHLPRRPQDLPTDVVRPGAAIADWDEIVTGRDLPRSYDPPEGFVASANDRPADRTPVPVGFFFSPDERVRRLRQALAPGTRIDPADLAMLHADVGMPSAPTLRDLLCGLLDRSVPGRDAARHETLDALRAWDGRHDRDSAGALAFELLLYHFIHRLHGDDGLAIYRASLQPLTLLREDVSRLPDDRLRTAAASALDAAAPAFARYRTWGAMHRLRLAHPLGHLPLIGRRWRFADLPVGGSNETLMKTAHGLSGGRHGVGFGANARLIADMADPDATHFAILGGQDGRFGSDAFLDQLDDWRAGHYRTLPLTVRAVATAFPAVAHFGPCPGTDSGKPPLTRSLAKRRRQ